MDRGKIFGFNNRPVGHGREHPRGTIGMEEADKTSLLPTEAILKDFELIELRPQGYSFSADPYILYNHWGHILYQWPDNYEPGWMEVFEVCQGIKQ